MLHAQVIVDVLEKLDVRAGFVRSSCGRTPSFEIEYGPEALTFRGGLRCYSVSSASLPFQLIHDGIIKFEKRRSGILLEVFHLRGSGNREYHGRLLEKPRE